MKRFLLFEVIPCLILLNDGVGGLLVPVVVIGGAAEGVLVPEDCVQPTWSREARCEKTRDDQYSASHGSGFIFNMTTSVSVSVLQLKYSFTCKLFNQLNWDIRLCKA